MILKTRLFEQIEVLKRYECPVCGELHENENEAGSCCGEYGISEMETRYKCPSCGSTHTWPGHAIECCRERACPLCGEPLTGFRILGGQQQWTCKNFSCANFQRTLRVPDKLIW